MTTWNLGRLCVFDTETTGPDPTTALLVTACVGEVGAGQDSDCRTWLIDPGCEIPAEATAVHGVGTERARAEGADAAGAIAEIRDALYSAWESGVPVVTFNAAFDLTVLDRELRRHGMDPLDCGPVIDPFVIDREVDKYRKGKRTLSAACEVYGVVPGGAHDATVDALAAAEVARAIAAQYPHIAEMPLAELHAAQATWHAERQADFAAYLRRSGKPADDVHGDWPLLSSA